jgi:mannonate dehydratase
VGGIVQAGSNFEESERGMQFSFRWYGPEDPVTLEQIRQIPGVTGIVADLFKIPVGAPWPLTDLEALKKAVTGAGLKLTAIESIPVHEEIKLGLPSRDKWIARYIESVTNVGKAGIPVVTYNFMPVFDWFRSDLNYPHPDGATSLAYQESTVAGIDPSVLCERQMPAWAGDTSPEQLKALMAAYQRIDSERLWQHLAYFLKRVVPAAEAAGVKLALHPDDPPWPLFGLPRIIVNAEALARVLEFVDSPANGLALCSGSLGAGRDNDIPAMIRRFGPRIHFAHVRNVRHLGPERDFIEAPHPSQCGSLDMFAIMKAYHDVGFKGVVRPDHGRMIWGEQGKPGYGLYDRALGATYLMGLWEAMERQSA